MNTKLDIENWARIDHFYFFRQFEEPFFGITVTIDCTEAYRFAKEQKLSFFLYYLYQSLRAANETEPFRYRIHNNDVLVFDEVHASPTINRPDGTFGFAYMDYHKDFREFSIKAAKEIERVQQAKGLIPAVSGENVIHYSSLPWINFTGLAHGRAFSFHDRCAKISFGKMTEENGKRKMPVSIHVHHALMDGYHVGRFIDIFQELMQVAG